MRRTGFTVIELIVVVSILALLLAILSPALRNSKEQAKAIKCAHNIKQLLLAFSAYGSTNNYLPYGFNNDNIQLSIPKGGYAGNQRYDKIGWWWFNFIGGIYEDWQGEKSILWCPSNRLKDPIFSNNVLCGNYGVNQSLFKSAAGSVSRAEFSGTPVRLENIRNPGETLLIADAGYSLINWWHVTEYPAGRLNSRLIEDCSYIPGLAVNQKKDIWQGMEYDAVYGRHLNKKVNAGFADGHLESLSADSVFVEKLNDGYTNRVPLWGSM